MHSLQGALVPVLLLLLWEAGSRLGLFSPVLLPSPSAVAAKWWAYLLPAQAQEAGQSTLAWWLSGELLHDAWSSLYRVVAGFLIGAGLALPLGLALVVRLTPPEVLASARAKALQTASKPVSYAAAAFFVLLWLMVAWFAVRWGLSVFGH